VGLSEQEREPDADGRIPEADYRSRPGNRKIAWHGLYAGRRAAATLLVQLTGNAVAAQFVLRHKNLTTTTAFYVKPVQTAGLEGMKLVEEKLASRKALAESNGK
jgi:hypothetical protein